MPASTPNRPNMCCCWWPAAPPQSHSHSQPFSLAFFTVTQQSFLFKRVSYLSSPYRIFTPLAGAALVFFTQNRALTPRDLPLVTVSSTRSPSCALFDGSSAMSISYDNLDPAKNEIRLIRFLRNGKSPIEVSLETVSRDDSPVYRCLSYVWGNPAPVRPIIINRVEACITENLDEALRRLECEEDVELLWVDAICINQADHREKAHQVGMMGSIYSEAEAVLAWIGPEENSSGEVMAAIASVGRQTLGWLITHPIPAPFMGQLVEAWGSNNPYQIFLIILRYSRMMLNDAEVNGATKEEFFELLSTFHSAVPADKLAALFSRPYWRRVWIIQELYLARKAYLICGPRKEDFEDILAWARIFSEPALATFVLDYKTLTRLSETFESIMETPLLNFFNGTLLNEKKAERDILALLRASLGMQATVAQDRVFALISLASGGVTAAVNIDYDAPLPQLLEDLVKNAFIANRIELGMLNISDCPWAKGSPSWVALAKLRVTPEKTRRAVERLTQFRAPDVERFDITEEFHASADHGLAISEEHFPRPGILRLPCYVAGVVASQASLEATEAEKAKIGDTLDRLIELQPERIGSGTTNELSITLFVHATLKKLSHFLFGSVNLAGSGIGETELNGYPLWWLPIGWGRKRPGVGEEEYSRVTDMLKTNLEMFTNGIPDDLTEELARDGGADAAQMLLRFTRNSTNEWFEGSYVFPARLHCRNSVVFKTLGGYVGIGIDLMQLGDCVVIIPGVDFPYIAREVEAGIYQLLGASYVAGLMYGEFFGTDPLPEATWMEFC